ncbi:RICIN domain-containing protein [Streptomyces sp. NPDC059816]|uniref:RICIN domain-containing protein n=1 Tax=Streptomyces sp. NPDC059816 TaxID=3346960 RepID=UPI00364E3EE5
MHKRALAALATAAGLLLAMAAPAQAAPSPGTYTVTATHSGKCLDLWNSSAENGTALVQNTCDGRPSQRFTLREYSNAPGTYAIRTFAGKCLARGMYASTTEPVQQRGCVYDLSQAFKIGAHHPWSGEVIFSLNWSGERNFCFHVDQAATDNGTAVITHACNPQGTGVRNDTFTFQPS